MLTYSWIKSIDVPLFIHQHHIIYSIHILYLYLPWLTFNTAYVNWEYIFYISLHRLPVDGNLLLTHIQGFKYMDDLLLYMHIVCIYWCTWVITFTMSRMNTVVLNLDKNVLLKNMNSGIVSYINFPLYFIMYEQSWVIMKLSFFKLVVLQHKDYTKNFTNSYIFSDSYYTLLAAAGS